MSAEKGHEPRESSLASGWTVEGRSEAPTAPAAAEAPSQSSDAVKEPANQLSNGALVLMGLLGGIYLLYTVVWFSWANAKAYENELVAGGSGSIGGVLQQLVFWLAPLAPVLWFVSVLVLTRESPLKTRVIWFAVGIVLLLPLPMFGGLF